MMDEYSAMPFPRGFRGLDIGPGLVDAVDRVVGVRLPVVAVGERGSRCVVASVPWGEGCEGVGVARASVQEVVGPLGDVGVRRVMAELGGCGLEVEVRGA